MIPRSVRCANPGNIERGANWRGLVAPENMTPEQEAEHRFCVFQSPEYGFRALALLLRNYLHDGHDTIREIIERYAPSGENNTAAYIRHVCQLTGFNPDQQLEVGELASLAKAIATHETGGWAPYWTDEQLQKGISMMGAV